MRRSRFHKALALIRPPTVDDSRVRIWHRTENWCSLCKEPFNSWNEHRGKRDHICLELFYDAVVRYERSWHPANVLSTLSRFPQIAAERLFGFHDRQEHRRRHELFFLLSHLLDSRFLSLNDKSLHSHAHSSAGSIVMFKWYHPAIIRIFPNADAKQVSCIAQMCASTYNAETVFDLCGFKDLFVDDQVPRDPRGKPLEINYYLKGVVIRSLLGQLRWALEWEHAISPIPSCPQHLIVLAQQAGRRLVAETVFCRVCEYVCRVEAVWKEMGREVAIRDVVATPVLEGCTCGCQRLIHDLALPARSAIGAATSRSGMLAHTEG